MNHKIAYKCEHLIGRMGYFDVFDATAHNGLREMLKNTSDTQATLSNMSLVKGSVLSPREIADNRRGYLQRFNYCPYCGGELNWKHLIDEATK